MPTQHIIGYDPRQGHPIIRAVGPSRVQVDSFKGTAAEAFEYAGMLAKEHATRIDVMPSFYPLAAGAAFLTNNGTVVTYYASIIEAY